MSIDKPPVGRPARPVAESVVREMFERCMTFGEFVAHHKLFRAEGVVLRYLTDAYRALRSTVPTSARTEEVDESSSGSARS